MTFSASKLTEPGAIRRVLAYGVALAVLPCCSPHEPVQVSVPTFVSASEVTKVTTDENYEVELSEARLMVADFTFAIAGEAHAASVFRDLYDWMVPNTLAHPGHFQGGAITGELPGRFLLDWLPGNQFELGRAELLEGTYTSANFVFAQATASETSQANDPLLNHTALLRGTAQRADRNIAFLALIDSPEDRQLVGIPFEATIRASSPFALLIELKTLDPLDGDTLFDGIDFDALDEDSDGNVHIVPDSKSDSVADAYNRLRRTLQTHDHFAIRATLIE